MESQKKGSRVGYLFMVLLALSVVFVSLAYGLGKTKQAVIDAEYYNSDRIESLCQSLGYNKIIGFEDTTLTIDLESKCLNNTADNTTNSSSCGVI